MFPAKLAIAPAKTLEAVQSAARLFKPAKSFRGD